MVAKETSTNFEPEIGLNTDCITKSRIKRNGSMLPKGQVHDGKSREKDASEGTGSSIRKKNERSKFGMVSKSDSQRTELNPPAPTAWINADNNEGH